jgi:hypothetical protein
MAVTLTSPAVGQQPGYVYTGPLEDWLVKNGYALIVGDTTDKSKLTGSTPANDPTLASNREDPNSPAGVADPFVFGTDATLTPYVRSLTPATGLAAGGTAVVADGDNFTGVTAVTVGGVATTGFEVVDDNTIHFTTGPHAAGAEDVVFDKGSVDKTVTDGFTYTA